MNILLIVLFVIAALGHWTGKWKPDKVKTQIFLKQFLVGTIMMVGAALCWFLPKFIDNSHNLNLSISLAVTLFLWLVFRNIIYNEWKKPPAEATV